MEEAIHYKCLYLYSHAEHSAPNFSPKVIRSDHSDFQKLKDNKKIFQNLSVERGGISALLDLYEHLRFEGVPECQGTLGKLLFDICTIDPQTSKIIRGDVTHIKGGGDAQAFDGLIKRWRSTEKEGYVKRLAILFRYY